MPYPFISDPGRHLAQALGLPTFTAGGQTFYERVTLIAGEGRIGKVFYPVFEPEHNATQVLEWLESHQRG